MTPVLKVLKYEIARYFSCISATNNKDKTSWSWVERVACLLNLFNKKALGRLNTNFFHKYKNPSEIKLEKLKSWLRSVQPPGKLTAYFFSKVFIFWNELKTFPMTNTWSPGYCNVCKCYLCTDFLEKYRGSKIFFDFFLFLYRKRKSSLGNNVNHSIE